MPRWLRRYVLGCIAITFAYLIWHANEPLRLNIGDPWSDAELAAKLDVLSVGTFRLFALAFSALGTWTLFQYLKRMWSDSVACLGAMLFTTSLLSLMNADSLQSPPFVHAGCFIALWGLVRAIETHQLRHYIAVALGSFACMFASSDDWLFWSAGVLYTTYAKRGDPLARGNFRFVATSAVAGIAGALANSQFVVDPRAWPTALDRGLAAPLGPLLTLDLTPMVWITLALATWRALRAPSLRVAFDEAMIWVVVVAVIFVAMSSPRPGPPLLRVVSILPCFATASAILIDRALQGERLRRTLGIAWVLAAPLWGFVIMLAHPRALLDRDDVASVRTYLAGHDGNDFVISNLLADGVVRAAFDRRSWSPIAEHDPRSTLDEKEDMTDADPRARLLEAFEAAGTDRVHAVIFTTPDSRFIDRSLGQIGNIRGLRPFTAAPYLHRDRANKLIDAYDARFRELLDATGAQRVLHFSNFDVYRIDRAALVEQAGQSVPVVSEIDFTRIANRHTLVGWLEPELGKLRNVAAASIAGYGVCTNPPVRSGGGEVASSACETAPSRSRLRVPDARWVRQAQLMIRVDRVCDLRLTVEVMPASSPFVFLDDFTSPVLGVSLAGFTASQCSTSWQRSYVIPRRFVRNGINVVTFTTRWLGPLNPASDIRTLAIDPLCDAAP